MPYEDRYQDHNEDDDNYAYGSRPAPTAIVDYNRAISHTSHCSFRSSQSGRFIPRVQASVPGGGEASGMWVWSGLVLCLGLAGLAWWRSRAKAQTYYEAEVYGMDAAAHRKYGIFFWALALVFLVQLAIPGPYHANNPLSQLRSDLVNALALPVAAVAAILYGASFVRGASGEDE